jgi:hypothetical protein
VKLAADRHDFALNVDNGLHQVSELLFGHPLEFG